MVETERKIVPASSIKPLTSEIQVQQPQTEEMENGSIIDFVLRSRGIDSINKIPYEIRTDFALVDIINIGDVAEEYFEQEIKKSKGIKNKKTILKDLKIKLLGFRLWSHDPNFKLIKEYLPEGSVRWESISEIIDDKGELGRLNN